LRENCHDNELKQISANVRRRKDFFRLPVEDQKLLEEIGWKSKLDDIDTAIQANARFLRKIVMNPEIFEGGEQDEDDSGHVDAKLEQIELQSRFRKVPMTIYLADFD
jgi:carnosine N-methyltransferase